VREITYGEAIREALREEMLRDETVFLMGEDIGIFGGPFKVTKGLVEEFGPERVRDTPLSETGFMGAGVGAALTGMRPVVEVMYHDFLPSCMDQIVNQAAKLTFLSGGQAKLPLVIRSPVGRGRSAGAQHSQNLLPLFMHIPGLEIVAPSTPYDAKGLLKTAIRGNSPVMFFEHMLLYRVNGRVPKNEYTIPIGKADIKRKGKDVTVVAISLMVHEALSAAEKLEQDSINIEVVDPRTLVPLDDKTIVDSVKKTGRLVVVEDSHKRNGVGSEIAAMVAESEAFDYLTAPFKRLAATHSPIPYNPLQEKYIVPNEAKIIKAVKEAVGAS